ncbi:MAG: LamG domain-containing protein [Dysgonamonadaceae bacterium]|jgi:hypothetical protein|nr:LamG domain-containing protein [Dysgonamonadaceae bacterium]
MKHKKIITLAAFVILCAAAFSQEFTLRDLMRNAEPAEDVDFVSVFATDVYRYFSLYEYDTPLKRKNFEQTQEYRDKLSELQAQKQQLLDKVFYLSTPFKGGSHYAGGVKYGYATTYNLQRKGFPFALGALGNVAYRHHSHTIGFRGGETSEILFAQLPATATGKEYHLFFPIDEPTGAEMENYMDNLYLYVFFTLSGQFEMRPKDDNPYDTYDPRPRFSTEKIRLIVADKTLGTIYYDRSYNEPLKILPEEKLTGEQLAAYRAQQAKQAQERRERRAQQAEAEQQAALAKENFLQQAKATQFLSYYTFEGAESYDELRKNTYYNKNEIKLTDDTPSGKGKALLLDGERFSTVASGNSIFRTYTLSFWLKDFGVGKIAHSGGVDLYCSESGYFKLNADISLGDATELMYDSWHLLTLSVRYLGEKNSKHVYDCNFYIDGKLVSNTEMSGIGTDSAWLFNYQYNNTMKLDNIRIYYRALSAAEVAKIYEEEGK